MNKEILDDLKKSFQGDIDTTEKTLKTYSRDASLFEIKPQVVIFPKNSKDVQNAVRWVNKYKKDIPGLSITPRSAGTDMSGGPLNESIILDFTRYMNKIGEITDQFGVVEPGCFYRDFDKETRKINRIMPTYTASREICAVGGMVANNAGGEKSIKYGKTEDYLKKLKVVFSDGNEYEVRPMTLSELEQKTSQNNFEGNLYKKLFDLINENYETIVSSKPNVSKNSSGYYLWNVYDKEKQTFDLCKLIVGSQGTLGIVTEITFKLVPTEPYSNILVVFLPSLDHVSQLVNEILPFKPESLETYDDKSMILAVRFFFDFFKQLGFFGAIRLGLQFIPETWMMLTGGVPKLILMIEFADISQDKVRRDLEEVYAHIKKFGFTMRITKSSDEADKYWRIRHESFNLLRKHVHNKRTAPFIDDIIVKPEHLPEFLPQVKALLDEYKLDYTVQGHLGNGNFHIIPLIDLDSPYSADIILELSRKVYDLVHKYKGSNSAEHNDGIIRTPYLLEQFGPKIIELFEKTKNIFDPENIFNPNKKVHGTFDDIKKWLIKGSKPLGKDKKNSKISFYAVLFLIIVILLLIFSYIYQLGGTQPNPNIVVKKEVVAKIVKKKTIYPSLYSDKDITINAVETNRKFKNITFSDVDSFLANTISSIKKDFGTSTTNRKEMGSWIWTPISQITTDYTKKIISGAKENNINTIYLSIDTLLDIYVIPNGKEKDEKQKAFDKTVESFIKEAHKNNIEVYAEAGWRNWAEPENTYKAFAVLDYVIKFNKNNKEGFIGFQYDVEPYLLERYQKSKESVLRNFLALIDKSVTKLNNSDLELSVVIPEFYDGRNDETPEFSYKGNTGHTFDHLISILDRRSESKIILMSYRNYSIGEDGSIDISANEIYIANQHNTKVIIAQETGDVLPSYITFFKTSKRYYNGQVSIIEKAFGKEKGFGGIATHYINSFIDL